MTPSEGRFVFETLRANAAKDQAEAAALIGAQILE
jgi:hypothetical protein